MNDPVPNTNGATNCVTFTDGQTGQAWGGIQPPQPEHVCPACGYCPCCGRRKYDFQPYDPWYPNTTPWYPTDYPWTVTCYTTSVGTGVYAGASGGIGAASAQSGYFN